MRVKDLGEFGLIQRLADRIARDERQKGNRLILGIGDDAAAWHTHESIELLTTDTLVQDVHFRLNVGTWRDLGWKALAVNVSDIAAMGGIPQYAVVTLGLSPDTEVSWIDELYEGMLEMAGQYPVRLVGGDLVASPVLFITIALVGAAFKGNGQTINLLTRSSASVGDAIAVTGHLGSSAGGLRLLLQQGLPPGTPLPAEAAAAPAHGVRYLTAAHLRPQPRVAEGQALARNGVRTAIDISDGLVGDLRHICEASRVGAWLRTDWVPVHPYLKQAFGSEALPLALSGGEDYELLFTARSDVVDRVKRVLPCPITVIGEIVEGLPGMVTLLDAQENMVDLEKPGWEHFRR